MSENPLPASPEPRVAARRWGIPLVVSGTLSLSPTALGPPAAFPLGPMIEVPRYPSASGRFAPASCSFSRGAFRAA